MKGGSFFGFLLLGVSDMAYKVCPKCKKELPATSEYFYLQLAF